jgi:hypothetical protein
MVRDACQRYPLVSANWARSQSYVAYIGNDFCVFVECLVEITQPEEDYGVWILLLYLQVLATHGSGHKASRWMRNLHSQRILGEMGRLVKDDGRLAGNVPPTLRFV